MVGMVWYRFKWYGMCSLGMVETNTISYQLWYGTITIHTYHDRYIPKCRYFYAWYHRYGIYDTISDLDLISILHLAYATNYQKPKSKIQFAESSPKRKRQLNTKS